MKKIVLFIAILILSSFKLSIETREAQAQNTITHDIRRTVKTYTETMDGMTYRIFVATTIDNDIEIQVINTTKEKLEVEKLKLEIKNLK
jgi:hypothetical protein